jgi:uncharacterized protein YbjT (DUF2867 family)
MNVAMRIAVLGASGVLGRAVTKAAASHTIVPASRRTGVDVTTGEGLAKAFQGADVVIDATNAMEGARDVLFLGTKRVLEAARDAGVKHFVGISIVGIDDGPVDYYRVKVEQEKVIEQSPIPWSFLRATQFHDLVPRFVKGALGVVPIPSGWKLQPIDVSEVAAELLRAVEAGPQKRMPDIGGPEVREMIDLARAWHRAKKQTRLIFPFPLPGKVGAFLRSGKLCTERPFGTITFEKWLGDMTHPE